MKEPEPQRPIEVEAVRLPLPGEEAAPASPAQRIAQAFLPVVAGFFLDVVDFASRQPLLGLLLGTLAGWWVGGKLRLALKPRAWLTLGSAIYCAIPGTQLIPLGTILGALCRIDLEKLRTPTTRRPT